MGCRKGPVLWSLNSSNQLKQRLMTPTWEVFAGHGKRSINRRRSEALGFQEAYQFRERLFLARKLLNSLECTQEVFPSLNTYFGEVDIALAIRAPHVVVPAEVNPEPSLFGFFDAHGTCAATEPIIILKESRLGPE